MTHPSEAPLVQLNFSKLLSKKNVYGISHRVVPTQLFFTHEVANSADGGILEGAIHRYDLIEGNEEPVITGLTGEYKGVNWGNLFNE